MAFRTGDPLDDFNRLDMQQAMLEARLPICDKCGERIHDEEYYDIDGEILCEDCLKEKYRFYTADLLEN